MAATAQTQIDTVPAIDAAIDSVAADSVCTDGLRLLYGVALTPPQEEQPVAAGEGSAGMSWMLTAIILVFVVACLRYRKNTRYISQLLNDIIEVRERHNAFDDTLRETSFLWLLNLLWCALGGVLLYFLVARPDGAVSPADYDVGAIGICIALAGAYTVFLAGAYSVMGRVFSDGPKATLWVKGYLSTQGLEAIVLFPVAMIAVCVPAGVPVMVLTGAIVFILAKILFIYKGFCIFFANPASWVLFLYYLCSLEIVPVVLTYVAALKIC